MHKVFAHHLTCLGSLMLVCVSVSQPLLAKEKFSAKVAFNNPDGVLSYSRKLKKGVVVRNKDLALRELAGGPLPEGATNYDEMVVARRLSNDVAKNAIVKIEDFSLQPIPGFSPIISRVGLKDDKPQPLMRVAKDIPKGEIVALTDVLMSEEKVNLIPPHSIVSPYCAIGRVTTRDLKKGQIFFVFDVGLDMDCAEENGVTFNSAGGKKKH